MKKTAAKRYEVVCSVCYTCVVGRDSSKKRANVIATGHLNAYGHNVSVIDRKGETK